MFVSRAKRIAKKNHRSLLLCQNKANKPRYIEDITWPVEIRNFSSSVEKSHISKRACNFLFIIYKIHKCLSSRENTAS